MAAYILDMEQVETFNGEDFFCNVEQVVFAMSDREALAVAKARMELVAAGDKRVAIWTLTQGDRTVGGNL